MVESGARCGQAASPGAAVRGLTRGPGGARAHRPELAGGGANAPGPARPGPGLRRGRWVDRGGSQRDSERPPAPPQRRGVGTVLPELHTDCLETIHLAEAKKAREAARVAARRSGCNSGGGSGGGGGDGGGDGPTMGSVRISGIKTRTELSGVEGFADPSLMGDPPGGRSTTLRG